MILRMREFVTLEYKSRHFTNIEFEDKVVVNNIY